MRNLSASIYRLLCLVGLVIVMAVLPNQVNALTISPPRQTVIIDPGGKQAVRLLVENDSLTDAIVLPQIEAFRINEQTGRAVFGASDEAIEWIKPTSTRLRIAPRESRDILFEIVVPPTAEPGSHYLGLFAVEEAGGSNIGATARVGSLLFLHVAGAVREEVTKQSFSSAKKWYVGLPVQLFLSLRNNGTIHVIPQGEIKIETRSSRVVERQAVNFGKRKILPGGDWEETYKFEQLGWRDLGRLRATAYIQYGLSSQQIIDRVSFWYVPVGVMMGGGGAIIVFTVIVVWLRNKQKKALRKQKIIE